MAISLKKAYRACLWLAEQKIGVNPEDRRGEWDLTKPEGKGDDFKWQRRELVAALPFEYYENSAYSHPYVPEAQSSSDGDDLYDGATFIDASNMIDGPLFSEGCENNFEDFSPNRNRPFFHPSFKMLSDICKPEKINLVPRLSLQTCKLSCENVPIVKENHKPALASVMAHCTLMELLKEGEIQASCRVAIVESAYDVTSPELDCGLVIDLPRIVFNKKIIPNYEVSATEVGLYREKMMAIHFSDAPVGVDVEFISRCEFWFRDITVSDSFESWHMEKVRALSSEPDNATFKMVNGKYLIQYSTDKTVEYKAWKGFSMLYKVMRFYKTAEFNPEFGCEPFEIELRSCEDEVEQYENLTTVKKNNESRIRKYIRKQQNLIFWSLENFHNIDEFDDDSVSRKGEVKSIILAKLRSIQDVSIKYNYAGERVMKDEVEFYIRMESSRFFDNKNEIKKIFKVDFTDDEKDKEKVRKNIHNALKELGVRSPDLAMHLGSILDGKKQGVGYNSTGFYYISNAATEWDFG